MVFWKKKCSCRKCGGLVTQSICYSCIARSHEICDEALAEATELIESFVFKNDGFDYETDIAKKWLQKYG